MLAIDLCAGSGWAVACAALGISELGIEIMPEAIATRTAMGAYSQDISIADLSDNFCSQAPIQIAGPPCQTFSMAGNGEGRQALEEVLRRIRVFADTGVLERGGSGDPRTWLVLEPLRLAIGGMPTYIAWEQVPPVLPVWEACGDVLRSAGYSVVTGILNSEQYGVPQTRRRAFLLARRDGIPARFPAPTHSRYHNRTPERLDAGVLPWVSMAEALGFTADMRSNYGVDGDPTVRGHRGAGQPSFAVTSKIDRNYWQRRNSGPGARRDPRPVDSPSYTIRAQGSGSHPSGVEWEYLRPATTVQGDPRIAPPGHHDRQMNGATRVTVAEAAALQSFPPAHPFQGTMAKQYLQIGNAVPPLLGKAILSTFLTETT